jgi:hypothetical protein
MPSDPPRNIIQEQLEAALANGECWRCPDTLCGEIIRNYLPACHNCGKPKPVEKDLFNQ